jgi:hypothetical protein
MYRFKLWVEVPWENCSCLSKFKENFFSQLANETTTMELVITTIFPQCLLPPPTPTSPKSYRLTPFYPISIIGVIIK